VLVGITTGGKIGLGLVALVFIGFALTVSFLLPRRNPDFPGERLRGFVWLTILLFVALMAAVVVFAREEEGHAGEAGATHATTETGEATDTGETTETGATTETGDATETETETGETATGETDTGEEPTGGEGDPAAGEEVFAANGCGSCHTLEAAGSSGGVGPNLDDSQPDFELVVERVTNGAGAMPSFRDTLSEQQIRDVAAYVVASTGG
jgi:cytochrome c6